MPRPANPRTAPRRGDLRLLHDLAVLERALGAPRVSARTRLRRELGAELLPVLRASLAGPAARVAA